MAKEYQYPAPERKGVVTPPRQPVRVVSQFELAELFTEWEKRRREDPDTFDSGADELSLTPAEYGVKASAYLFELREELLPSVPQLEDVR